MTSVISAVLSLKELLELLFIAILDQVTDFFKFIESLTRVVPNYEVNNTDNMFIKIPVRGHKP